MLPKHKITVFCQPLPAAPSCNKPGKMFFAEAGPAVARSHASSLLSSLIADDWKKSDLKEASPLSYYQDFLGFS